MNQIQRFRVRVYERDGYRCVYCGSGYRLTIDHIVPACRGGGSSMSNLATCCYSCNRQKKEQTGEEFRIWLGKHPKFVADNQRGFRRRAWHKTIST